ncbi:hypothetical protein QYE76_012032 [Lolium multiflorum]|uniref:Uncharacterized protein n=1 Tax=Lolium multiflorum TaxID=4521 RepID=A0AAD8TWG3_LOLMU|nr:hypothetical protein QYE76_012032 [Lolium multiflorum]
MSRVLREKGDRMEKLEQEVFNYKKMAEREVDIFTRLCLNSLMDTRRRLQLWDDIFSLHDTTNKLQAQLYDVHNQNYDGGSQREDLTRSYSRLCGAENTREKRALRRAESWEIPSRREIDTIAIVIELDIISIIIIIISTIYTAITTAAPRHRCNNLG